MLKEHAPKVMIKGCIAFSSIIGIHDEERITAQKIRIIYCVYFSKNINNKNIKLMSFIKKFCQHKKSLLIENLSYSLSLELLNKYNIIDRLEITVEKPCALLYAHHAYTSLITTKSLS